jgi:UPF0755 protein
VKSTRARGSEIVRYGIAIILLFVGVTAFGYRYVSTVLVSPGLVYIPNGSDEDIIDLLRREDIGIERYDIYLMKRYGHPSEGWVRFDSNITRGEFFWLLPRIDREPLRRIVFYSGDTIDDFSLYFGKYTGVQRRDLLEYYYRYSPFVEGGIMAGYYYLPYRIDAKSAVVYMIWKSDNLIRSIALKYGIDPSPESMKRYLIVASIVQKETYRSEEMPYIASVVYNRLKRGMRLQMDATLNYGSYSHDVVTPRRIREDTSSFNSYLYPGLPPEPLCSVTPKALEAAISPAKTEYLYFVKGLFGTHEFSRTYEEHLAKITKIKAQKAKLRLYRSLVKRAKGVNGGKKSSHQ